MNDDNLETVVLVLAGLLRQHGGVLVMNEDELGETSDRVIINVEEETGVVTLTLVPDYVNTGVDETVFFSTGGTLMPASFLEAFHVEPFQRTLLRRFFAGGA